MKTVEQWKTLLRAQLRAAQLARRSDEVTVLRETLAAIDNAEAPPAVDGPLSAGVIAGSVEGVGATEVMRRELSPDEIAQVVGRELEERRAAAASYASLGRSEDAARLAAQAELLARLLAADA